MAEEIELQTSDDLKTIDYMRTTNQAINSTISEQQNTINNISDNLDVIADAVTSPTTSNIDLSEVTDMIDNIDTAIVENNTQDILSIVNQQQEQINDAKRLQKNTFKTF